jgi:type VI secretion system secreted protein VgrG
MAVTLSQAERWLTLETPLGEDVLVATYTKGSEAISRLFEFRIEAMSTRHVIDPATLLGKSVTLSMSHPSDDRRLVNGIVTAFSGGAVTRSEYRLYTLTVSPSLWLLQRTSDYKVFQEKTAVEIVETLLSAASISFEKKLQATYEQREYCIQFGETNFAFFERLLAEEGIFYYFTHDQGSHKLILADHAGAYGDCLQSSVAYRQNREDQANAISSLDFGASLTDAEWKLQDYNFEAPAQNVEGQHKTSLSPASTKSFEHFRFPGGSLQASNLTRLSTAAVDAADAGFETINGRGTCASFTPGLKFTLTEYPIDELSDKPFVLTEIEHEAFDRAHFTVRPEIEGKPSYRNRFTGMPTTRIARGPLAAPKPLARGPQTALVVGPSGEEIHTDKYGRIRIQFFWDRYGTKDEKSSCFVRVAQGLAGSNWGMMFTPRIGMEVVVQFIDGDPDKPLVTGAVYNGANMPPWALPGNMTKSGLLTRSSKQGQVANANELSFEDNKGSEKITFHAEKDFLREVENDDTLDVGHDQTRTIKNNRTTTITEGNDTLTISKGNRTEKLETGNETLDIDKGNRAVTIATGNETLKVSTGNRSTTVEKGDDTLTVSLGNQTTKANAGKITLEATQGITLKCGGSTIEVTQQGIKVNGVTVAVQASASAEVKGAMLTLSGDGMATVKGGIVKIN